MRENRIVLIAMRATISIILLMGGLMLLLRPLQCHSMAGSLRARIRNRLQHRAEEPVSAQSGNPLSMHYLQFGGLRRSYALYVPPSYSAAKPASLLIVLHGGGGHAQSAEQMAHLVPIARQQGVILVYPNGTGFFQNRLLTWNAGNCCGEALDYQNDDSGYIRAVIGELKRQYNIDPRRINATGISNGGMMSYKLACDLSDQLAGIAPVAGALNVPDCNPKEPVSVIAFHGTADRHVLYKGGVPLNRVDLRHPRVDHSVAQSVGFWVQRDGCQPKPLEETRGNILIDTYPDCSGTTGVQLYTIKGGGHAWPGGQAYFGGDTPTREISASALMMDFFKAHPKSASANVRSGNSSP